MALRCLPNEGNSRIDKLWINVFSFAIQVSLSKSAPPWAWSKAYRSDQQPFHSASFSLPPPNRPAGCQSGAAHRKSLVIPFKENSDYSWLVQNQCTHDISTIQLWFTVPRFDFLASLLLLTMANCSLGVGSLAPAFWRANCWTLVIVTLKLFSAKFWNASLCTSDVFFSIFTSWGSCRLQLHNGRDCTHDLSICKEIVRTAKSYYLGTYHVLSGLNIA